MTRQNSNRFAVIVPIGPGTIELRRFHDLLDSLFTYEPGACLCIAIDSERCEREVAPRGNVGRGSEFITLHAPFQDRGEPLMGQLCARMLLALRTAHQAGPFEFVLRMDTDALVIGRFREAIHTLLAEHPEAGILGTL